jgi:Ni/Co efflux regulator RcnB
MMSTTNFLLVLIAAMLGLHWYPDIAKPLIAFAIFAWLLNEVPKWNKQRKLEKAKQNQLDADKPLREEFWAKHKAIRDKYDPKHEWNEGTSLPAEYTREMAELNAEYHAVMDRWHNQ